MWTLYIITLTKYIELYKVHSPDKNVCTILSQYSVLSTFTVYNQRDPVARPFISTLVFISSYFLHVVSLPFCKQPIVLRLLLSDAILDVMSAAAADSALSLKWHSIAAFLNQGSMEP